VDHHERSQSLKEENVMLKYISVIICSSLCLLWSTNNYARQDKPQNFAADMNGGEQVLTTKIKDANSNNVTIPIGPLVTGAHGYARFSLSNDKTTLHYQFEAMGFSTPLFMAHIHLGPEGANGPPIFWLFGDQSNAPFALPRDDGPWTGSISGTLTAANLVPAPTLGINTFDDAVMNIMQGNAYINLHTTMNKPGEIRGQIHRMGHDR
jgi:hypothetical protein